MIRLGFSNHIPVLIMGITLYLYPVAFNRVIDGSLLSIERLRQWICCLSHIPLFTNTATSISLKNSKRTYPNSCFVSAHFLHSQVQIESKSSMVNHMVSTPVCIYSRLIKRPHTNWPSKSLDCGHGLTVFMCGVDNAAHGLCCINEGFKFQTTISSAYVS